MPELTPEIAPLIVAACQAGADELANALSRSLDRGVTVEARDAAPYDPQSPPDGVEGPGLGVVMTFGDAGALAFLAEATGLTPRWAAAPDAEGASKLASLAEQLSGLLVPETLVAEDARAVWLTSVGDDMRLGGLADDATAVPIALKSDEIDGTLWIIWPLSDPDRLVQKGEPQTTRSESGDARPRITDFADLPPYSRSLLQIAVPLSVVLANKKQPIREILELGTGSIIAFDKACDAPVEVFIGDEHVARGETVKVGEKFGVKLREMILPPEHFRPLRPAAAR